MDYHRKRRRFAQLAGCMAVVLLAACATQPASRGRLPALVPAPPLPVAGATIYHVVPGQSQLRILVFRAGVLGDLGHNHVIVTSQISGNIYLHDTLAQSGFELTVPLTSLRIDPVAARAQEGAGFVSTVSADDREGTRTNMLGARVLDVARYPTITLRSTHVEGPPWHPRITVQIMLHGASHDYVVPTAIVRGNDRLTAIGALTLKQSDFGIAPFSVLAGAIKVQDEIQVSFRFVATRAGAPGPAPHAESGAGLTAIGQGTGRR